MISHSEIDWEIDWKIECEIGRGIVKMEYLEEDIEVVSLGSLRGYIGNNPDEDVSNLPEVVYLTAGLISGKRAQLTKVVYGLPYKVLGVQQRTTNWGKWYDLQLVRMSYKELKHHNPTIYERILQDRKELKLTYKFGKIDRFQFTTKMLSVDYEGIREDYNTLIMRTIKEYESSVRNITTIIGNKLFNSVVDTSQIDSRTLDFIEKIYRKD